MSNFDIRQTKISRRTFLKLLGAGASVLFFSFSGLAAISSPFRKPAQAVIATAPLTDLVTSGKWDVYSVPCPILPIHAALLHTNKVLFLSGSQNDPANFFCKKFGNFLWDPAKGDSAAAFNLLTSPPGEPHTDVFCCGQSFLSDGRLLIAGGTEKFHADYLGLGMAQKILIYLIQSWKSLKKQQV